MPTNKVYKFRDINEASLFLNGALFGAVVANGNNGLGISGLVGTTIKFLQPAAASYTFVTGAGTGPTQDIYTLSLTDIKTQLQGAVSGLLVTSYQARLVLMESTPANGVHITAPSSGQDARSLLGFDTAFDSTSNFYKPVSISTTPPCWVWSDTDSQNMIMVHTWE